MPMQRNRMGLLPWYLGAALCLCPVTGSLKAQPTLRITSPADGTIVNAGSVLTVSVEASPAAAFQLVMIIGEDPIGFSQFLEHPPYRFTMEIPRRVTPRRHGYDLTPVGRSGAEPLDFKPLTIFVERPDLPEILLAGDSFLNNCIYPSSTPKEPYRLHLNKVGAEEMLYLMGIFPGPGLQQVDLTESKYVKYSSDNLRVAKVDEIGTVHATGIGSANITISYRNKSVAVPVTVGDVG
jgi:hypothetical protein